MTAPKEIIDLVERFRMYEQFYQDYSSKEDMKNEFISPLFEALGWDVYNSGGHAPFLRDVFFKKRQETIEDNSYDPDYVFRSHGISKFFVEVVNPSKKINDDIDVIRKVVKHGHKDGLDFAIITNFKEFILYDTRTSDKSSNQVKIKYYQYEDYVDKWDEISGYLSKDTVDKGKYNKFLSKNVSTESHQKASNHSEEVKDDNKVSKKETSKIKEAPVKKKTSVSRVISSLKNKMMQKETLLRDLDLYHHRGVVLPRKDVLIIDEGVKEDLVSKDPKNSEIIKPFLEGKDINKRPLPEKYMIDTGTNINVKNEYPVVFDYLKEFKSEFKNKRYCGLHWYNVKSYPNFIDKPKIIYYWKDRNFVTLFDSEGKYYLNRDTYYIYKEEDVFFLKILNTILSSNLMKFYIRSVAPKFNPSGVSVAFYNEIKKLPIIDITRDNPKISHLNVVLNNIESESNSLKAYKKASKNVENPGKSESINKRIHYFEEKIQQHKRQVDNIVYELYDITPEEIEVIEEELTK